VLTPFDDWRERLLFEFRTNFAAKRDFLVQYGEYKEVQSFQTAPGNVQFLLLVGHSESLLSYFGNVAAKDNIFPAWFLDKVRKQVPWSDWNHQTVERFITLTLLSVRGIDSYNTPEEKLKIKLGVISLFLLRALTGYTNRGVNMYATTYQKDNQNPALITFGKRKVFISPDLEIGMYNLIPLLEAGLPYIADAQVQAHAAKAGKKVGIGFAEAAAAYFKFLTTNSGKADGLICTLSPEMEEEILEDELEETTA